MFGRNKNSDQVEALPEETPEDSYPKPGKGAPTPKRKDQEAARKRPLVPNDRKAARQAEKQAVMEQRAKVRQALNTGEEKYLPVRDRGDRRRYIRDFVDARTSVGEFFMYAALLVVLLSFFNTYEARVISFFGFFVIFGLIVLDAIWLRFQLKKRLTAKFGGLERGDTMYAITRSIQIRRLRLPKPLVKRGQYPA